MGEWKRVTASSLDFFVGNEGGDVGCCVDGRLGELGLSLYREKWEIDVMDIVDSTLLHISV